MLLFLGFPDFCQKYVKGDSEKDIQGLSSIRGTSSRGVLHMGPGELRRWRLLERY
jgi:hypothetical protein